VVVVVLGAARPATAAQRPGTIDRAFGDRGKVVTTVKDLSFVATAMGLQADGSILVGGHTVGAPNPQAGDAVVLRFTSSGRLDTSFGVEGVTRVPLAEQASMDALAVGADGRIVLAGGVPSSGVPFVRRATFARLTSGGAADASFGDEGIAAVSVGDELYETGATIHDVVIQPDGKVVAVGSVGSEGTRGGSSAVVMRVLADGSPDPGFGSNGALVGFQSERATGVTLDGRGGIVVAAEQTGVNLERPGQLLARIPTDAPGDYRVTTRSPRNYVAPGADVAIVRDGRILLSGSVGEPEDFIASTFSSRLRFLASHRTNLSRGRNSEDVAVAAASDRDGGALVVGSRDTFSVGLARYAGPGLPLDRSFGRNGRATIDFPGKPRVQAVASQPDGGIVVLAGTSPYDGPPYRVFLARFRGGYDHRRPIVRLTGLPRGCAGRRARLRVLVRDASPLAALTVWIDRRRVRSVVRRRLVVRLWRERSGRHRLTVRARDVAGNKTVLRRQFRTCPR